MVWVAEEGCGSLEAGVRRGGGPRRALGKGNIDGGGGCRSLALSLETPTPWKTLEGSNPTLPWVHLPVSRILVH